MVDFCESYSPFHVCLTIRPFAHLVYTTSHLSLGQPRYQIWIKCDKRQMTSCVHKMCEWTHGQTNMKRVITLAKINHPWNRHNMRMLYATSHLSFIAFYSYLVSWLAKLIWACAYYTDFTAYGQTNMKRATTLAKINQPWNRYNMRMLRS
jgi:hypothetical protein